MTSRFISSPQISRALSRAGCPCCPPLRKRYFREQHLNGCRNGNVYSRTRETDTIVGVSSLLPAPVITQRSPANGFPGSVAQRDEGTRGNRAPSDALLGAVRENDAVLGCPEAV
ncbi:hypothetical protein LSAT2_010031 [Lamellibrachia satsuma]|nr:hypothetical protein LSAT2_010031 [Lamellibrachia satsuma]